MENNVPSSQDPETRSEAVGSLSQELEEIKRRAAEENQRSVSSGMNSTRTGSSGKLILLGALIFFIVAAILIINIIKKSPGVKSIIPDLSKKSTQTEAISTPSPSGESEPVLVETGSKSPVAGFNTYTEANGLYSFSYPSTATKRAYFESGFSGVEIQNTKNDYKSKIQVIYITDKENGAKEEGEETHLKAKPYVRSTDTLSMLTQTAVGDKSGYFYTIIGGGGEARDYFIDVKDGVVRIKVIISGKSDGIISEKETVDKIIKSFDFTPGATTKGGL